MLDNSNEVAKNIKRDRHREAMLEFLSDISYWGEYSNEELEKVLRYLSRLKPTF